jgi:hypothetical protein
MPAKFMHSFIPWRFGVASYVFAWSNDPAEDPAFLAYLATTLVYGVDWEVRNAAVDRSGAQPQVTWEMWRISTNTLYGTGAEALSTGSEVYLGFNGSISVLDTTGYWDSDQYGRPFDLNDLLA